MIPGIIIGVILTLATIGVWLLWADMEPAQELAPESFLIKHGNHVAVGDYRPLSEDFSPSGSEPVTQPSHETLAMLAMLTAKWPVENGHRIPAREETAPKLVKIATVFPLGKEFRAIDLCTCHHDRSIHYLTGDRLIQFECSDPNCTCKNFMPVPYIEESNERPRVMPTIQERLEEAVPEFIEEVETYRIVLPHPNPNEIQRAFWGLATPAAPSPETIDVGLRDASGHTVPAALQSHVECGHCHLPFTSFKECYEHAKDCGE